MAQPQKINKIINFQTDSVVSKELVRRPTGTVTLFAFDQGQGLSEHTAPYDALVIATEGSAELSVSGEKNVIKSGEMFLILVKAAHSLIALQPFKMILIMIKSQTNLVS